MVEAKEYSKPSKGEDYQYASVMGRSYNPFYSPEVRAAYMVFEVSDFQKFYTEKMLFGFESKDPLYDDGRVILEEGNLDLKAESRCITRKHRGLYVLEEVELQQEGHRLEAAGALYVPLLDYKRQNPVTISPVSIDAPGDKRNLPMENRFDDALKRECSQVTKREKIEEISVNPRKIRTRERTQLKRRRSGLEILARHEKCYTT